MKKNIMNIIGILIVGILSFTIVGCTKDKNLKESKDNSYVPVEVETLKLSSIDKFTMITGKVVSENNINIIPKILGEVTDINLKVGDKVKKGQVLLKLDEKHIMDKIKQAKIVVDGANISLKEAQEGINELQESINSAKANYKISKANYDINYEKYKNSKENLNRSKKLYDMGIISKSEYEKIELMASSNNLKMIKSQFQQAKKILKQTENTINKGKIGLEQGKIAKVKAEENYKQAREALRDTVIKSPIDGVVNTLNIHKGEISSNVKPIITLVDLNNICVKVSVTEGLINKFKNGDKANVYIPSLKNKKIEGEIYSINKVADFKTNLYDVEIKISNYKGSINPGMFVNVEFNIMSKKNILAVNSDSILTDGDENFVYVEKGSKVIKKDVILGDDNSKITEIKSGLSIGDRVIKKGQHYIEEDSKIKVVNKNNNNGDV